MLQQFIVTGFHRSGTSMTMQALVKAGLYPGDALIGADPSNQDGHFEDIETVRLHDQWLADAGSDWCHAGELPDVPEPVAADAIRHLADRLGSAGRHWGIKDPRAALFLDSWFASLRNPVSVLVYRHFASCLSSLQRRQANALLEHPAVDTDSIRFWSDPELALRSWLCHNRALISHAQRFPERCVLVSQEALLAGVALAPIVNQAFSTGLSEVQASGVDQSKALSLSSVSVADTAMKSELERTWEELQTLSHAPAPVAPNVQWFEAGCEPSPEAAACARESLLQLLRGMGLSTDSAAPIEEPRGAKA